MTEAALEEAVDKALGKADYDLDGMVSWEEYHYSLYDKDSDHQTAEADNRHRDVEKNNNLNMI